ncbi:MAG: hypothetical protein Q9163_001376 [Psora crenata]
MSPTSPKKFTAAPSSPQRPVQMPRSKTFPSAINPEPADKPAQAPPPLQIETKSIPQDNHVSEICLSPSWSDHGEKERRREKKKQEKEQKESGKRRKQEEEGRNTAEYKSGKRLSKKPPPAAMETQKMPAELRAPRRNSLRSLISGQPRSRDGSERNSRDEKRLSGTSLASFLTGRRSHSEQRRMSNPPSSGVETPDSSHSTESWRPVVSAAAPRLPSFRWSSKKASAKQPKSIPWGGTSIDSNGDEFLAFAYQLDDSPIRLNSEDTRMPRNGKPDGVSLDSAELKSSDPRGQSEAVTEQLAPVPPRQQEAVGNVQHIAMPTQNGHSPQANRSTYERSSMPTGNNSPATEGSGVSSQNHHGSRQIPASPKGTQTHTRPSHDGSSYVHKQRMYQQQRSIAGFEDEQAVRIANEQATKAESQPTKRDEQPSLPNGTSIAAQDGESTSPRPLRNNERSKSRPRQSSESRVRQSPSPSRRISAQQVAAAAAPAIPSPLKAVSQAPESSGDSHPRHEAGAAEATGVPPSTLKNQATKTDKILGFRRRTKQPPEEIVVPETKIQAFAERASASADRFEVHEQSTRRSRIDRMSAQIPFRTRRDSANSQKVSSTGSEESDGGRGHLRTRTASSQLLNANFVSPGPVSAPSRVPPSQAPKSAQETALKATDPPGKTKNAQKHQTRQTQSPSRPALQARDDPAVVSVASTTKDAKSSTISTDSVTDDVPKANVPKDPELVVQSMTGDGIVRKTSITKSRSNPQLQTVTNTLPSLDFLPQLKHQPLVKTAKRSSTQQSPSESTSVKFRIPPPTSPPSTAYKSPLSPTPPDLALMPRSPLRSTLNLGTPGAGAPPFTRSSTSITPLSLGKTAVTDGLDAKPMAKLFVICCKCKFWHDLPAKLYEAMALPKELHNRDERDGPATGGGKGKGPLSNGKAKVTEARLDTAVKCTTLVYDTVPQFYHDLTAAGRFELLMALMYERNVAYDEER